MVKYYSQTESLCLTRAGNSYCRIGGICVTLVKSEESSVCTQAVGGGEEPVSKCDVYDM